MHGYFMDARLYRKAHSVAAPYTLDKFMRDKINGKLAAEKKYSVRKKKIMERMERPVIISRKYFENAISDIFLNIRLDLYYCIA